MIMPSNGLVLLLNMSCVKSELENSSISHADWHSSVDWPVVGLNSPSFLYRALAVHVRQDVRLRRTI